MIIYQYIYIYIYILPVYFYYLYQYINEISIYTSIFLSVRHPNYYQAGSLSGGLAHAGSVASIGENMGPFCTRVDW